jgi:small subunit ribosomal protein S8
MVMTDPIADMLTRIRNALRIERASVDMPCSKIKIGVAEALKREGFICSFDVLETQPVSTLRVQLKYGPNGEQIVRHIQRASRPGRRLYWPVRDIKPVLAGQGIGILSTSRGVLSDRECRQRNIGGELLCTVW